MKIIHAQEIKSFSNIAIIANQDEFGSNYEQFIHDLVERLQELEFSEEYISLITATSFLDLPLIAKTLAKSQDYTGILMLCFYHEHEYDEYLATLAKANDLDNVTNISILAQGISLDELKEQDSIRHIARALADRIYSTMSIMEQIG